MSHPENDFQPEDRPALPTRRQVLGAGIALATASLLPPISVQAQNQGATGTPPQPAPQGRRRLGRLEVSAVGMGVQNMHRKYTTEVPYRPELINILRAAHDRGVTFFDCAEAYGPFENERILGKQGGARPPGSPANEGGQEARTLSMVKNVPAHP